VRSSSHLVVSGVRTELVDEADALDAIQQRVGAGLPPLGVASINLDHIHHFGNRGAWHGALGRSVEWLNLIDGAPIADKAKRLTGVAWPRLAGSDLIGPILDRAEADGVRVGFLGGSEETRGLLLTALERDRPGLAVAGAWSPSRAQVTDPAASLALAEEVRESGAQILVVGLGKPRQELWIEQNAVATGADVLLAFGAVVDFLAGRMARAPRWAVDAGMEWAWRLALEPRRLARRYLVQGPPAFVETQAAKLTSVAAPAVPARAGAATGTATRPAGSGGFVTGDAPAEVAAVVVTFNNSDDVDALVASLRAQAADVALRVVVADNSSTDGTPAKLAAHADVTVAPSGGNLGYAGGINVAMALVPAGEHILVVNPDLTLDPGALRAMLARLDRSGAGVVAPVVRDADGGLFPSLRREPSVVRALGDAALGSRFGDRSALLSDIDADPAHYCYAHPVDWASGAALLIRADVAAALGPWDEQFFLYSEETDFQRRVRAAGDEIWFEPAAVVRHEQGGSGGPPQLTALMAVNRVRYVEKYHGPAYATAYRGAVLLSELLRAGKPGHADAVRAVADRNSWRSLPQAEADPPDRVQGAVIIPAHNEASVIGRTLASLGELVGEPGVEVIVVCNGTTDATADIARSFAGVTVVEVAAASKVAALNEGDRVATRWPRLYLDADIEISPAAVRAVFAALSETGEDGAPLLEAARPSASYDRESATRLVHAYYRARGRVAGLDSALWGAGAYGVNECGHTRFAEFPPLTADDLFVDRLFPPQRKAVIRTEPVVVRLPRDAANLARTLRRGARANAEHPDGPTTGRTAVALVRSIRGPRSAADAAVYAAFAGLARVQVGLAGSDRPGWERDVSSR